MKSHRGLLVVISSPSGAGKTTLCQMLTKEFPRLVFSVSVTTRPPRTGEREGVDYRFVDLETFQRMIDAGEFAEWAEVHGNRYGTTRAAVAEALQHGRDVLFDIDWQGGEQLKRQFERDAVMIWVLPPSLEVLEQRLRKRATDSADVIDRRLAMAKRELEHFGIYDYLVKNDEIKNAYDHVRAIYLAAHLETDRAREHADDLLKQLQGR
jgi:guanylate kinase